ncbi:hypothetical protein VB774_13500 [Pseudanabaena galeata UHCC 0370]|uniref:Uncharacterized protein n=1 Tax=Pseudanabaena galeata UHCC 0370 TaxID=3110310 RepID=A0ABU5TKW3_9CYAN|nr:hypothetical protein [Pseudanabaena galeata UHCC 0370]
MPEKLQNRIVKHIKKADLELEDDLRPEYDLKSLRVRKLGSGRKSFGGSTVRLEPDVAAIFPNANAVNEALRFLIRVAQQNQSPMNTTLPNTQENTP